MGLCGALARDRDLEVLGGAVPELAAAARAEAETVLLGPSETLASRLSAELESLLERPRMEALQSSWANAPSAERLLPGVRQTLLAWLSQHGPSTELPADLEPLAGPDVYRLLARLAAVVADGAAAGEAWAGLSAVLAARECGDVNLRLAPAVAMIAIALCDDEPSADCLAATWPAALVAALDRCRRSPALATSHAAEAAGACRARLARELGGRG